jgi:MoxR-like ATPase
LSVQTAQQPKTAPIHIGAAFRQITSELSLQFFERTEEIDALACTMLAKQHGFILGPPGVGKSNLVEELCLRIESARYWDILMDRQLGKEESFGPTDIALYEQTSKSGQKGIWQRDTENTLLDAHVVFVDEVGKAGPASLNPYLRAFNERKFRNGKTTISLPLITAIGASNEYLEPELAAMWDRFLVRLRVGDLEQDSNFAALLDQAVSKSTAPAVRTTVHLTDFQHAVDFGVPAIKLPPGVVDSIVKLRKELRAEEIMPSPRRWKQAVRLLQAAAYMGERSVVDDDDLQILQHVLWDVEAQIPTVQKKVLALTSPITKAALEIQQMLDEISGRVDSLKGKNGDERAAYGGEAQFKLTEIKKDLNKLTEDANRQGRSTSRLDALHVGIKAIKQKVFIETLNVPEDRAKRMAEKD